MFLVSHMFRARFARFAQGITHVSRMFRACFAGVKHVVNVRHESEGSNGPRVAFQQSPFGGGAQIVNDNDLVRRTDGKPLGPLVKRHYRKPFH